MRSMLVVIAGPAGTGKTTLADNLAEVIGVPHIDFDTVGAELLAIARADSPDHAVGDLLRELREARYQALADAVRSALRAHPVVIASAPFTAHMADPDMWQRWLRDTNPSGGTEDVVLMWLDLDPGLRWGRLAERGSDRDGQVLAAGPERRAADLPVVPCRVLNAAGNPATLLAAAIEALRGPLGDSIGQSV